MTTKRCTASVWPHRHTSDLTGPVDVVISFRNLPQEMAQDHSLIELVLVQLDQPDDRTNLTILRIAFNLDPGDEWYADQIEGKKWYRVKHYRIRHTSSLKFYIKSRITNQMEHPIPRGRWEGTYQHKDDCCIFTLQAMTMKVQKEEPPVGRLIVMPDGFSPGEKRVATP